MNGFEISALCFSIAAAISVLLFFVLPHHVAHWPMIGIFASITGVIVTLLLHRYL
jgi:hypothetical protein